MPNRSRSIGPVAKERREATTTISQLYTSNYSYDARHDLDPEESRPRLGLSCLVSSDIALCEESPLQVRQ